MFWPRGASLRGQSGDGVTIVSTVSLFVPAQAAGVENEAPRAEPRAAAGNLMVFQVSQSPDIAVVGMAVRVPVATSSANKVFQVFNFLL